MKKLFGVPIMLWLFPPIALMLVAISALRVSKKEEENGGKE